MRLASGSDRVERIGVPQYYTVFAIYIEVFTVFDDILRYFEYFRISVF